MVRKKLTEHQGHEIGIFFFNQLVNSMLTLQNRLEQWVQPCFNRSEIQKMQTPISNIYRLIL